jgi:hypothetical protein
MSGPKVEVLDGFMSSADVFGPLEVWNPLRVPQFK